MPTSENIKVLVVDDIAEKLVVYRALLEEPGLEIVTANSGPNALRHLMHDEFAVILLDVNMPDMDGLETASLIRKRRRCAHTPIIFITAFADEVHALQGYALGAVDYILSPVTPDVLKTKVRVFVELFRKTREIQRQADALRTLEAREHQRRLSATNKRLDLALRAGRMGAWEWDLSSHLMTWSPMLEEILGFAPGKFSGRSDDLVGRLHPDDRDHVLETIMNAARRREEFKIEHRIIRPKTADDQEHTASTERPLPENTEVAWIEVRGKVLEDERVHMVGVCMDITERKEAEAALANYRAKLEELVLMRTRELERSLERLRLADRLASIGTLAAGLGHDMGNLLLPVRMRLEMLEKINLPEEAHEHLAAIRTASEYLKRLSQGLRLFALDPEEGDSTLDSTDLHAWWLDVEPFLRNALPRGVLLEKAFDDDLPPIAMPSHRFTQVIYNLVQNAGDAMGDRGFGVVRISAELAPASVDSEESHSLQSAAARQAASSESRVCIAVCDDGPGMSEEVKHRCMEPFFTTKTRAISTGLGLALVHGAVLKAGGSIEIDTQPGRGTTFRLLLPIDAHAADRGDFTQSEAAATQCIAYVALSDPRLDAYVASVLRTLDVSVVREPWSADRDAHLLVMDASGGRMKLIEAFLRHDAMRRAVVIGGAPPSPTPTRQVIYLESKPSPAQVRETLQRIVRGQLLAATEAPSR